MNIYMTRADYDALPDRQTYDGVPARDQYFRDSYWTDLVFEAISRDHGHWPIWWAFEVDFRE